MAEVSRLHPCPKCDEPLEQEKVGERFMWFCPRRNCNTVYEYVPTRNREVA